MSIEFRKNPTTDSLTELTISNKNNVYETNYSGDFIFGADFIFVCLLRLPFLFVLCAAIKLKEKKYTNT